jgi:hypothetical protein
MEFKRANLMFFCGIQSRKGMETFASSKKAGSLRHRPFFKKEYANKNLRS